MKLTDRSFATGVTVNDLIHIVITGDTTQSPQGSSFKASIGQITSLLNQSQPQEFYFDITIPSSDVLTLNTIPVELVPAQGVNTIILPTEIIASMIYSGTPYTTNGDLIVKSGGNYFIGGTDSDQFLFGTVSRIVNITLSLNSNNPTATQYVTNSPLTVEVKVGNPTAGNSDIRILGWYKVVTI